MRRLLAVALVVVLLVGTAPVATVSGSHSAREPTAAPQTVGTASNAVAGAPQTLVATDNFDSVEFHITVYENGTAEWTFTYQRRLDNETERQQFRRFADEFNNNSTELFTEFKRQARQLTSAGHNSTDRVMSAEAFSKTADVGGLNDNLGIVKMSFQWTGFGYSTDNSDNIKIGDVFEGGLYIGPNQSLVVHAGPGLKFVAVKPAASAQPSGSTLAASDTVTWQGERDFIDQRPQVTFKPVKGTTTVTTTTNESAGGGAEDPDGTTAPNASQPPADGDGWPPLMMFVAAVVVLLGLAAAFAWRQGDFGSFAAETDDPGNDDGGAAASRNGGAAPTEPSVSDEELLTDEARVKKLLDENGGRMKQVNIVDETGWSKSKVSMLLSEMEEDGDISKLRVGRENIISLEGHEPDAAGSPLEGE
ncbi:helix-turn-helix transcriptional regulator [Halorussus sp. AFM4]|uniref:helix-turn-helix transcriptional regulator n=1 Tax=Halorussus sp. AFM4 TaxID=3421651 RepID=UPI003EBD39ED